MSNTAKVVKLRVQDDGGDQIRDAARVLKKKKPGGSYTRGFSFGKKRRGNQVTMVRYHGSRQRGTKLSGPVPSHLNNLGTLESVKVTRAKVNKSGDSKKSNENLDKLEDKAEKDTIRVDGIIFESFRDVEDLPPMQLFNLEVFLLTIVFFPHGYLDNGFTLLFRRSSLNAGA